MTALLPSPGTIAALVKIGLLVGGLMTAAAYLVLVERWIAAWVQDRRGPNRVGIPLTKIRLFGLGQPLADGLKIIFKEDFTPRHVDKVLYNAAPLALLTASLAIFAAIPFGSVLPPLNIPGFRTRFHFLSLLDLMLAFSGFSHSRVLPYTVFFLEVGPAIINMVFLVGYEAALN